MSSRAAAAVPPPPPLRFEIGSIVAPGDRLSSLRRGIEPGIGTYARGGHIFASLVGELAVGSSSSGASDACSSDATATATATTNNSSNSEKKDGVVVVVVRSSTGAPAATSRVLAAGQVVLCRVQRIQLQHASLEIIAAAGGGCPWSGHHPEAQLRREDVRPNATDELKLETCFVPGDVVLARIVSMGDARRYLVSTAELELGVVRALSSAKHLLKATSWKEMECPVTGRKEPRKVAKPSHLLQDMMLTTTTQ